MPRQLQRSRRWPDGIWEASVTNAVSLIIVSKTYRVVLFITRFADTITNDLGLRILIMVADALVYHPTVAHYLRFVATTGKSTSIPCCAMRHWGPMHLLPVISGSLWISGFSLDILTSPRQSAATRSFGRCSTSRASIPGTYSARTRLRRTSRHGKPSRRTSR